LGSLAATTAARSQATKSTAAIARIATPATVTIVSLGANGDTLGLGSGFLVRANGTVVTNFHVLRGASSAVVVLATQERFDRVRVIDADSDADIALLKIPGSGLPCLPTRVTNPAVGERVVAIGSPLGLSQTVSEGIVSAVRVVRGRQLIQITAPISPGSSGGAVMDGAGRVFAISTSYMGGGQQLNFSVPVRYALGLLGDAQTTRSIAAVFASAQATATAQVSSTALPARASHVKSHLDGTYFGTRTWSGAGPFDGYRQRIFIVSAPVNDNYQPGWIAQALERDDKTFGPWAVLPVSALRTDAAGQVMLRAGVLTSDGYQTDDGGFTVTGRLRVPSATDTVSYEVSTTVAPYLAPLSDNSGIYGIEAHTYFRPNETKEQLPNRLDWSGSSAVIIADDTIYVDLTLRNDLGGTKSFLASGRLQSDGAFELGNDAGDYLRGKVRAGMLQATWHDQRSTGTFDGSLAGTRQ